MVVAKVPAAVQYESESVTSERLASTYGYMLASLVLTTIAAVGSYMSGLAAYMLTMNPWALLGTRDCCLLQALCLG